MLRHISVLFISIAIFASSIIHALDSNEESIHTLIGPSIEGRFQAFEDSLCFANHGFSDFVGHNPYLKILAAVADQRGACQGMVGVAAALKNKVVFRPEKSQMTRSEIRRQVRRAVQLHEHNCQGKVEIHGYSNTRELCADHEDLLKQRSLQYNLELAVDDIVLRYGWSFFNKKVLDNPEKLQSHLKKHLVSMYERLKKGELPLMLVHDHVTLVTGMAVTRSVKGYITGITLRHYDPNVIMSTARDFFSRHYSITKDGVISGTTIWDLTPHDKVKLACALVPKN